LPYPVFVLHDLVLRVLEALMMGHWQTFWVPGRGRSPRGDHPLLSEWVDLEVREEACRLDPGDPFMVDPDGRVDARLTRYLTRSKFAQLAPETKRNYVTDYGVFFDFLWQRGKDWSDATSDDLLDHEDWRRWSPRNEQPIGASKWNRELAALNKLYKWAVAAGHVALSPVTVVDVVGRHGEKISVPAARATNARSSNVKWLTPKAFRIWRDVGLRGYGADDRRDPRWRGRSGDRNAAFADLLFSSGMRRSEAGTLLTIEVPQLEDSTRRWYPGTLSAEATKSRRSRTFYASAAALRAIDAYSRTTRRAAIRRAQQHGRYDSIEGLLVVTGRSGFNESVLHWRDERGRPVARGLAKLAHAERGRLFIEGDGGLEPLALWLSEDGTPFAPHSWEGVFRAGSARCRTVLTEPLFMTPHMCRHSFALHMLVALHHAMDKRFGLTAEERRDFQMLYGDPWRMVRDLLGHASQETTRQIYLAPVSDLEIRSLLLEEFDDDSTELLKLIAAASERVLDSGEECA
ncbi:tyrosine-type recombinase/integrase, partial [Prauserella flavalba]|uniref:tyrosine-type recombinase/integrase n=1 Tax=Prauserella flavalba TaxID=1477506 RepID=UPI0036E36BFF